MILVVDIDGTLADYTHRLEKLGKYPTTEQDFEVFMDPSLMSIDPIFPKCKIGLNFLMAKAYDTFFITGRQEKYRDVTAKWLYEKFGIVAGSTELFMRANGYLSRATKLKKELFVKNVLPVCWAHPEMLCIFVDDDPYVLNFYSSFGLTLKAPDCWNLIVHDTPTEEEPLINK